MGPRRFVVLSLALSLALPLSIASAQDEGGGEGGGEGEIFVEPFAEGEVEAPELPESEETESRLEREEPHPDNVIWTFAAGGAFYYGNSNAGSLNAQTSIGVRRGGDVLLLEGTFQYGIAQSPLSCGVVQANPAEFPAATAEFCTPTVATGTPPMVQPPMSPRARAPGFSDWNENTVNLDWRLRYDHFFDPFNAFYIAHRGRVNRFAGIVPRVGLGLGYSRLVIDELQHLLSFDFGIDGSFDIYPQVIREQNLDITRPGGTLPSPIGNTDWRFVPSVRVGLTYVNHLNAFLTYDTTFEALWDVSYPTHFRFEWVNHLRSAIDDVFAIRLDVTARFDSLPPGQAQAWVQDPAIQATTMFDLLTTINLQGTFDLDGPAMYRTSSEGEGAGEREGASESENAGEGEGARDGESGGEARETTGAPADVTPTSEAATPADAAPADAGAAADVAPTPAP